MAMFKEENILIESPTIETDYETERGKPMPSQNHGQIQLNVGASLRYRYKKQFSIMTEVELDLPNSLRPTVPDISIFPKRKMKLSRDVIRIVEPPVTTIEVLSPSQSVDEVKEKIFDNYFPAGVQSAWLIIPTSRTVSVYTPDEKFTTYASGKFTDPATGITMETDEVFEDLE